MTPSVPHYDVSLKDEDEGMSEREYRRFLARLSRKQRAAWEKRAVSFEAIAGADSEIDLREFQRVLEGFLQDIDDDLVKAELSAKE